MSSQVPGSLRRYLQASRGSSCLVVPKSKLPQLYADAFARLVTELGILVQGKITPPELILAYSATAHVETISLNDGGAVVVYDQYLGQVFNRLNRLYFEKAAEPEVSAYLHKLSAARCLVVGDPQAALRHAALFAALNRHLTAASPWTGHQRRDYTFVGEVFVLAHELMHFLYRTDRPAALALEDFYIDLVCAVSTRDPGSPQLTGKERAAKIRAAHNRLSDRQRLMRERAEVKNRSSRDRAVKQLSSCLPRYLLGLMTPHLLEECVCDGIAVLITSGWALRRRIRIGDCALGSFLALHNLRLLRWIDAQAARAGLDGPIDAGADGPDDPSEDVIFQTQLRFDLFRDIVVAWLSSMWAGLRPGTILPGRGTADQHAARLVAAMIDMNEQYSDIIFDHATSSSVAKHEETAASTDLDSALRRNPGEDAYDVVMRVCNLPGWRAPA